MPSTWAKPWLYPLCVALSLLAFGVFDVTYPHAQPTYVAARYAQNLLDGAGLIYAADERILLLDSPLPILAEAAVALPGGDIAHPSSLIGHVLLGLLIAGWLRLSGSPWLGLVGAGVWLLSMLAAWGGPGAWVAAFALLA
ncbi:MAG: hypothetical protein ACLFTK_10625, partial [Anaerolineales bacterium]